MHADAGKEQVAWVAALPSAEVIDEEQYAK